MTETKTVMETEFGTPSIVRVLRDSQVVMDGMAGTEMMASMVKTVRMEQTEDSLIIFLQG